MDLFGERESDLEVLTEIEKRIAVAQQRYGAFASTHEALGVALEEWDELRMAIQRNDLRSVRHESLDLAAVLIRLARDVNEHGNTAARSVR